MKLISINISKARQIIYNGQPIWTGIYKEPVSAPLLLGRLGLAGDEQADLAVHGGIHKAVYAYTVEHYDYWRSELKRDDLGYGQFGENFTTQGMLDDQIFIGDQFQIGDAIVEVTQPRAPCYKLAVKMERPDFVRLFLKRGYPGFYLRVLQEGMVKSGDTISRVAAGAGQISVREVNHLLYFDKKNLAMIQKVLKIAALSPEWRIAFQQMAAASH